METGSVSQLAEYKKRCEALLRYQFDYYQELAYLRSENRELIQTALLTAAKKNFSFEGWQRAVSYRYSLTPLSVLGSLGDPGSRFNIGDIDSSKFSIFPALYVGEDKSTALCEFLGQDFDPGVGSGLTHFDYALKKPDSVSLINLKGNIDTYFDLTEASSLASFADVIKTFTVSKELRARARALEIVEPSTVKTDEDLLASLMDPEWRKVPMLNDIPANSQIFGQLLSDSGIEAVLYRSKKTQQKCLAIFTRKFFGTTSFVALSDEPPSPQTPRRIDGNNFKIAEMTFDEISTNLGSAN